MARKRKTLIVEPRTYFYASGVASKWFAGIGFATERHAQAIAIVCDALDGMSNIDPSTVDHLAGNLDKLLANAVACGLVRALPKPRVVDIVAGPDLDEAILGPGHAATAH